MRFHILLLPLLLTCCQTLSFYTQGIAGQAEILRKSRPNSAVINDPATPVTIRNRLNLTTELCNYATNHLALPGNSAYHRYADLGRRHVVFVIHAAPEFSLKPKTWYYPIIGNLDYRGFFKEADAEAAAATLRSEGYEVHIGGTDAYSTLGLFHDPVLNTFVDYPEIDYAETIFHELTHRRIFKKGDTVFNESLANTVAEAGIRGWLGSQGREAGLADYEERLVRRRDFYHEVDIARRQLTTLYASTIPENEMRREKQRILADLKIRARALQDRWGTKPLEEWLATDLTNGHLLALIAYNSQMPRFQKILEDSQGNFDLFFKAVEALE